MKTSVKTALAVVFLAAAIATTSHGQQYPKATGYVNDFADLLSHEKGALLNAELAAFERKTEIEIAIVTVPQLDNQSVEDYTKELAKKWGVGKRSQNNGVVFLIAPKERKMRIETASGVRKSLTDKSADWIRDSIILPRFKTGNITQGIIDGTHAIMRILDASSTPVTIERETSQASQLSQNGQEIRSGDIKIFGYVLGSIVGVGLLGYLIISRVRRQRARKCVLDGKEAVSYRFEEADRTAKNADVKNKTREKLAKLTNEFYSINRLTTRSDGVKWIDVCEKLGSSDYQLGQIVSEMEQEIAFAEKARREGPELLKKIPGMIEEAEKKLAEGKSSPKAVKWLDRARTQYTQVQHQQSGMTTADWIILYSILVGIRSDTEKAESAHQYANTEQSSAARSDSTSDSSPSYGFGGDISGFGGGSGFDSSGGGSSGSW